MTRRRAAVKDGMEDSDEDEDDDTAERMVACGSSTLLLPNAASFGITCV